MAQLMPLPLTVSCFSKIQIGFAFLVPAHAGSPGKRVIKRVCVCVVKRLYEQPNCIYIAVLISIRSEEKLFNSSCGSCHGSDVIC